MMVLWPLILTRFQFKSVFLFFQGSDIFAAKINIEVQRASEGAIAAIERNGGVITTSFYDPISLGELINNYFETCLSQYYYLIVY